MTDQKSLSDFISENKIKIDSELVANNPHMDSDQRMNHYRVVLKRGRKQMTLFFSKGLGLSGYPEAGEVLDCLASDSAGVENAQSFEDWASEYGYDTDSRKAEKTFKICEKQAEKLKNFLGDDLYETLLWNTERM